MTDYQYQELLAALKEIQRLLEENNKISKELLEKSDKGTFDYTGPM